MIYVASNNDVSIGTNIDGSLVLGVDRIAARYKAVRKRHVYQASIRLFMTLPDDEQLQLLTDEIMGPPESGDVGLLAERPQTSDQLQTQPRRSAR